jgi:hypothetical protein
MPTFTYERLDTIDVILILAIIICAIPLTFLLKGGRKRYGKGTKVSKEKSKYDFF